MIYVMTLSIEQWLKRDELKTEPKTSRISETLLHTVWWPLRFTIFLLDPHRYRTGYKTHRTRSVLLPKPSGDMHIKSVEALCVVTGSTVGDVALRHTLLWQFYRVTVRENHVFDRMDRVKKERKMKRTRSRRLRKEEQHCVVEALAAMGLESIFYKGIGQHFSESSLKTFL